MDRVLVTGATGFIGLEVARQLVARGLRPRLMVHRRERGLLLATLEADPVYADLRRPAGLARVVEGVDTVIHLAARATFERYEQVRPSIVDGSIALMRAAREAGVARFVYASSLLVYPSSTDPIDARTRPQPQLGYGRAKLEAEEGLRREAGDAVQLGIVRLPHVYGARSLLFDQIRRCAVLLPGTGGNRYAHLHVEDAAGVLIAAADRAWSGTSAVGDDAPSSWNEFFAILADYLPRLRVVRVPAPLAVAGGAVLETLARPRRRPTLYTADTVRGLLFDLPVRPGLLWRELGISPRHPSITEGVPASLDEAVAFRWLHPLRDRGRD